MGFKFENCFCKDLKTTAFIVAYFSLTVNSILLIWTTIIWAILANIKVEDMIVYIITVMFIIIEISYFVLYLTNFIFNILLLIGLHKNVRCCIIAYLVFTPIFTIAHTFEFIIRIDHGNDVYSLIWICVSFFVIVGSCFSMLLIFTYYRQADSGRISVVEDAV